MIKGGQNSPLPPPRVTQSLLLNLSGLLSKTLRNYSFWDTSIKPLLAKSHKKKVKSFSRFQCNQSPVFLPFPAISLYFADTKEEKPFCAKRVIKGLKGDEEKKFFPSLLLLLPLSILLISTPGEEVKVIPSCVFISFELSNGLIACQKPLFLKSPPPTILCIKEFSPLKSF